MIITTSVLEKYTSALSPDELIPFLEDILNKITPRPKRKNFQGLVVKMPKEKRKKVFNHFLSEGYDITIYSDSDYVQFDCMRDKEGTIKQEGYPYAFELEKSCEADSHSMLIYDDADKKDICNHFGIESSFGVFGINYFRNIDSNHLLDYLLNEKGYTYSYDEDGRCIVEKKDN